MMTLDSGNVLLKPLHRRQLTGQLKRANHLGDRLGGCALSIAMHRTGRSCEVRATVRGAAGEFVCRSRSRDWQDAVRDLVRELSLRLRDQRRMRSMLVA